MKRLSIIEKIAFVEDFKNGLKTGQLSIKYNICIHTARRILLRDGLVIKRIKPTLDESCFDKITEESAYWTGFLMTDGCITKNRDEKWAPAICLTLAYEDKEHVINFKKFLNSTHTTTRIAEKFNGNNDLVKWSGEQIGLRVCSRKIAQALEKFGVIPRKTHCAKVSRLEHNKHFWRGVIDGDRCLRISNDGHDYPSIKLVGSKNLMEQFLEYAKLIIETKATVRPYKNIYEVVICGYSAAMLIRELYGSCNVALERKLKKAFKIMEGKYNVSYI